MRLFRTFFFIGLVCLSSCSKEDEPSLPDPSDDSAGTMAATVNDVAWQSTEALARISDGVVNIIGGTDTGAFELEIRSLTPGKYKVELSVTPEATLTSRTPNGASYSTKVSRLEVIEVGAVTISELDEVNKTISGTFSAEIPLPYHNSKIRVRDGSFHKIPFITEAPSDNNTFSAKVAGVNMNATTISSIYSFQAILLKFLSADHDIVIWLPDRIGKGSHEFADGNFSPKASFKSNSTSFSFPSGSVIITLHNIVTRKIEGTFSFSAEPTEGGASTAVTEASFAINY